MELVIDQFEGSSLECFFRKEKVIKPLANLHTTMLRYIYSKFLQTHGVPDFIIRKK